MNERCKADRSVQFQGCTFHPGKVILSLGGKCPNVLFTAKLTGRQTAMIFQRSDATFDLLRWVPSSHPRLPRTTSSRRSNTPPCPPPPATSSSTRPPWSSSTPPPRPPPPCSSSPPWFSRSLAWDSFPACANQPHLNLSSLTSSFIPCVYSATQ